MLTTQRVALYVTFDSIERDLVRFIQEHLRDIDTNLLTEDEVVKARARLQKRNQSEVYDLGDQYVLVYGLDLAEKYQILMRHKSALLSEDRAYFSSLRAKIDKVIPIRNDTMHGRPLFVEDYSVGFAFANELSSNERYWKELTSSLKSLSEKPEIYVKKTIEILDDIAEVNIFHNLPTPEYDDTGFVRRKKLQDQLRKLITGRYPVTTVVGEGGNGKTALVLQSAYDLLERSDHKFDGIVWITAKTSTLTASEIKRIEGAISSSTGVFTAVMQEFSDESDDPLKLVYRLLSDNNILLIIDNLETVLDDRIRTFVTDVPGDSKLVFTSRVPISAGISMNVDPFSEAEANVFLRRLIETYGLSQLQSETPERIEFFCKRLGFKPLLIKWFAAATKSGLEPDRIVANPQIALDFCMENVFGMLDRDVQDVAVAFAVLPRAHSLPVIQHVMGTTSAHVERAVAQLLDFSILARYDQKGAAGITYKIKDFPGAFLSRLDDRNELKGNILKKFRSLSAEIQAENINKNLNIYNAANYRVRNRSDYLIAKQLKSVVFKLKKGDVSGAEKELADIKILRPGDIETLRTEAFLRYNMGDYARAKSAYEEALEYEPDYTPLLYWYGGFLMRAEEDYEGAMKVFSKALKLDPGAFIVRRELARSLLYIGRFSDCRETLSHIDPANFPSLRDKIIAADLAVQSYTRQAEHLTHTGDFEGAMSSLTSLQEYVKDLDASCIDGTLSGHVSASARTAECVRDKCLSLEKEAGSFLSWLEDFQITNSELQPIGVVKAQSDSSFDLGEKLVGVLKESGLQETYGFIRTDDGRDIFVHRSSVIEDSIWQDMCNGKRVQFTAITGRNGKMQAGNIAISLT